MINIFLSSLKIKRKHKSIFYFLPKLLITLRTTPCLRYFTFISFFRSYEYQQKKRSLKISFKIKIITQHSILIFIKKIKTPHNFYLSNKSWCREPESNRHRCNTRRILSPLRLPNFAISAYISNKRLYCNTIF